MPRYEPSGLAVLGIPDSAKNSDDFLQGAVAEQDMPCVVVLPPEHQDVRLLSVALTGLRGEVVLGRF